MLNSEVKSGEITNLLLFVHLRSTNSKTSGTVKSLLLRDNANMFDLHPHPSQPAKRTPTNIDFRLGRDGKGLPPALTASHDDYLVDLTGDDDPASAQSWPLRRKLRNAAVLGFDTLVASWGSSVYSAAVQPVSKEFHVGTVVSILGLTLYICGFATGPLAFAPMSELYGRKLPITGACFVFTCFMFAAATAKDFQTLMLTRFFGGVFASCPLAVVGGAFADLFGNETRGIAIAAFSSLVFIGPFISPIVGAFITESYLGWRWTEYITGIMGALAFVLDLFILEETYEKTLLQRRAAYFRSETQNFAIHHISEVCIFCVPFQKFQKLRDIIRTCKLQHPLFAIGQY